MGQRSRKRGRTEPAARDAVPESAARRGARVDADAPEPSATNGARRERLRGEARNEHIRSKLAPLAPGERPLALKIAVLVALIVATVNPALALAGYDVRGEDPQPIGIVLLSALMLGAAIGMWQQRYVAVLGFQALLGITVIISTLSVVFASNVWGVVVCVVLTLGAGWLFWKLVRVMSRMQMPTR